MHVICYHSAISFCCTLCTVAGCEIDIAELQRYIVKIESCLFLRTDLRLKYGFNLLDNIPIFVRLAIHSVEAWLEVAKV